MRYVFDCIVIFLILLVIAIVIYMSTGCQKVIVVSSSGETAITDEVSIENDIPSTSKIIPGVIKKK